MKMRTVRTAGLVGGLATGALLLTGTAAQAADVEVPESTGDLVMATPEALGGLPVSPDALGALPVSPDAVTDIADGVTDKVPGMKAVEKIPGKVTGKVTDKVPGLGAVDSVPGVGALVPSGSGAEAEAKGHGVKDKDHDYNGQAPQASPLDALPMGDLLADLGGGLPVPLPF
jgi:hypothetical protein